MPKNITLSVPDETAKAMDKLQEVNWSAVAREAIEEYLRRRQVANIAPIVERLSKERKALYAAGQEEGYRLAQKLPYVMYERIYEHLKLDSADHLIRSLKNYAIEFKGDYKSKEFRRGMFDAFDELRNHF